MEVTEKRPLQSLWILESLHRRLLPHSFLPPPLHFQSQALEVDAALSLPGRPGSSSGIFSHFSEGSAQQRLAGFFSCQDEGIVVTGSGTREGGEPFPQHRLS